ncbi:LutB/LldF family L-lactate oxidation iron-sulfur protein [Notoacmeibacter ruber]|uniref:Iron-sulfur cluster-binding protein n=1 Tax=Notoacmeibacter ruber TaxID=2670375 RepID=A0A3L7J9V7_9HYPH|nr:LutB/LldF family L-lactate oxidation iron-sulfur protein [Notoacmeibacter ruber]RLQ87249.1 iron-sulfur cluster-binding protein [Notoacmeibacter ruber]
MKVQSADFINRSAKAIGDEQLQRALGNVRKGFIGKRAKAAAALPEFEAIRDEAVGIKNHVLNHLDVYLERFEANVKAAGGHVHWARDDAEARAIILELCRKENARTVTKGKSMLTEEIELNAHLEAHGIETVETDLGEYIIQLRGESPSHIIAPAVHLNRDQVEADFRRVHSHLAEERALETPESLLGEAREVLRRRYFDADVGITGANFLVAETGSSVIVTNEGNGDLTQTLPRVHIALASIEKIVPTMEDLSTILRLLARSATGQEMSVYTTISTGPRRADDQDGPEEYHIVLLDNGRSALLGTEFQEVLRCIRCGACMNHCPVFHAVGGHAYGAVYPGPIGAVITPALAGIEKAGHLPNASTFCGRCESVCPMRIPLPKLMRRWRDKEYEKGLQPATMRRGISLWAFAAQHPRVYRFGTKYAAALLSRLGGARRRIARLPFASGWTGARDLPAPEGQTFMQAYAAAKKADRS